MSKNEIKWQPYPLVKPRPGSYLITMELKSGEPEYCSLIIDTFFCGKWAMAERINNRKVYAWAELPKPFKPITNTGKVTTVLAIIASKIAKRGKPYSELVEMFSAFLLASDWGLDSDEELGREFGFRFKSQILEQYDFED